MKFDGTSWRLAALVAAVSIGLSGCVGGGGKANVADEITGIASDGKALANATINITDGSKEEFSVTADENGHFSFQPGARLFPFLLSVTSGGKTFYSVALGSDQRANLNSGSTVIAQYALKTSQLSAVVSNGAIKKLTSDGLAQAEQIYLQTIRADSDLAQQIFDESPRTKQFQPESATLRGDAYDQYLAFVDVSLRPQDGRMVVLNRLPERMGKPTSVVHGGSSDDLLTGGLGDSGFAAAAPGYLPDLYGPALVAALRTNAIYNQYRSSLDMSTAGGYGALYSKVEKVPGVEYLAFSDDGAGKQNVSTMVQIPDNFNRTSPCILVVPAPELRNIYAATPTAEWGLKRGCAVAITDKGAGNGAEYLDTAEAYEIDGRIVASNAANTTLQFQSGLESALRATSSVQTPGRFAFKFAHSQQNPEKRWGRNVLDATKLAFYVLNEKYGASGDIGEHKIRVIKPEQTLVIVAGDGEGGSAALAAVEQDNLKLLDGVVASQPQAQLGAANLPSILQGGGAVAASGKSLLDYMSYANLYQPCAGLASRSAPGAALLDAATANNRCSSLRQQGLLTADTLSGQVAESLQKLRAYGWQPEADELHGASYMLKTAGAAMAYANAYGQFNVGDNLCGLSYGAVSSTGSPQSTDLVARLHLFAESNGMPPYGPIDLIFNDAGNSNTKPVAESKYNYGIGWKQAVSPKTGRADYAFDAAYCLRRLVVGKDPVTGEALTSEQQKLADAIKAGMGEVGLSAALQGRPAIVLHGRSDSVFPVNHSSRPYVARSLAVQGASNQLRYYEVLNAQHFDAALGDATLGGFDTRYVPMRHYMLQSLDLMYNHLTLNKPLPDSQVIRTVPRGGVSGSAPAITLTNAPLIPTAPAAGNLIQYGNSTLSIPN